MMSLLGGNRAKRRGYELKCFLYLGIHTKVVTGRTGIEGLEDSIGP